MRLSDVSKGTVFFIESMPPGELRSQGIRLGLLPGAKALCLSVLPGGPVVLLLGSQEIAVGRRLARRIFVSRWGSAGDLKNRKPEERRTHFNGQHRTGKKQRAPAAAHGFSR